MKLKTEPALVRAVLDSHSRGGWPAVKVDHPGVPIEAVRRWVKARAELGADWPTWEMQAEWEQRQEVRKKAAEQMRSWRRRTNYGRRPVLVDARGTIRRIRALQAIGWTFQHIADEAGMPDRCLIPDLVDRKMVRPETAAAIDKAYRALCMKPGPSNKTRRIAAKNHWAPPLLWDDIDHDKAPATGAAKQPDWVDEEVVARLLAGHRVKSSPAEKRAAMARWIAAGRSEASLCQIHGWAAGRYKEGRAA